jgi:hypothetical protein
MRLLLKVFAPLLTAILIGLVAWPLLHPHPGAVHRLVLKKEMAALRTPPDAKLLNSTLTQRDDAAELVNTYRSAWSVERLEEFYLPQFRAAGWEALPGDGPGAALCKGPYGAEWRVSGGAAGEPANYSLSMSWSAQRRCGASKPP